MLDALEIPNQCQVFNIYNGQDARQHNLKKKCNFLNNGKSISSFILVEEKVQLINRFLFFLSPSKKCYY